MHEATADPIVLDDVDGLIAQARRVAEWAGTTVQSIQELNPELRRWTTPLHSTSYELKVPEGTADAVWTGIGEFGSDAAALSWHTVRQGETLSSIARSVKVSRADLAQANYLSVTSRVTPGQQLVIPRAATVLLAARTENPAPIVEVRQAESVIAPGGTGPAAPQAAAPGVPLADEASQAASAKTVYFVRPGDTLSSIARLFKTTVALLKEWNSIMGDTIRAGERLAILMTPGTTSATR